MLAGLVAVGATLVLALLCGVLILPSPDDLVRQPKRRRPGGKAAPDDEGKLR
jgi:hypothetical protein